MASYEPGRIYLCLAHRHPGHYFYTVKGAWRFYNRNTRAWFKAEPEPTCTLMVYTPE